MNYLRLSFNTSDPRDHMNSTPGPKEAERGRRVISLLCVLSIGLLMMMTAPSGISAQTPPTSDERPEVVGGLAFVDEVKLTVVNIDVFVTDSAGLAVPDLTVDDFLVLQDGKERDLTHFAVFNEEVVSEIMVGQADPATLPPKDSTTTGQDASVRLEIKPVYVVLFIDNENLRPMDRNRVLLQVQRFLAEIMYPHVQVMVVSYQRSLKIQQSFTSDSREVGEALRSVRKMTAARPVQDTERKKILNEFSSIQQKGSGGNEQNRINLENQIRSYADVVANELDFAINAVREVSVTLSGLPGRKYLVHVSSGLPMVPAKDLLYQYSTTFQNRSTLALEARLNHRRFYQNLASAANSQGVTFYTIDASGVGGAGSGVSAEYAGSVDPITTGLYQINQEEPLQYLAEKTGGRAIVNTNDIAGGLDRFRQDLFSYYSLAYTISGSGGDTVHSLEVELPGHPEYELNYRRNFVEKSLESKVQDRVFSGLTFDIDENPMGLSLEASTAAPASDERWILPIEIGFPLASIALVPEGENLVGRVVVFVAVRDDDGRQSDLQRSQYLISVARGDFESHGDDRYTIELPLLMKSGNYRIVVGLMDQLTRQASYHTIHQAVS